MAVTISNHDARNLLLIECENWKRSYLELLYAVHTKHPGQTRHETALAYIQSCERSSDQCESTQSTRQ